MATASTAISWTPLKPDFGAEIEIDLNEELTPAACLELNRLFDERGLLVFRNQDIEYETQRKVVSLFGKLLGSAGDAKYVSTVHDVEGNPIDEPRDIDPRATMFHSDLVFMPAMPIRGISLFALDVQKGAGKVEGTRFVSARQAYLNLPASARDALEGRTVNHLHSLTLTVEEQTELRKLSYQEAKTKVDFSSQHPVFFTRPRTGDPVLLYIPWFAHSIEGMSQEESQQWFDLFDALLYDESRIYTHPWRQNDLLVWDNVSLQHAKQPSKDSAGPVPIRVLRRAIMGTEQPDIYHAGYSYSDNDEQSEAVA